jgi:NAD(P)H-hydrate epimerase
MRIRTFSVDQARRFDQRAEKEIGLPSLVLMENAGIGLAHHIRNFMIPPINICKVVMICGTGNNGGDAFAAARHLLQQTIRPLVFLAGEEAQLKGDAAVNYRIIKKLGIQCESVAYFPTRQTEWNRLPILVIDALVGTGFKPPLRDPIKGFAREINRFKKNHTVSVKVLSVDVPTGLDADSGVADDDTVRANMTVTFACLKPGLVKPEARQFVGRTEVVDIGIPESLYQEVV